MDIWGSYPSLEWSIYSGISELPSVIRNHCFQHLHVSLLNAVSPCRYFCSTGWKGDYMYKDHTQTISHHLCTTYMQTQGNATTKVFSTAITLVEWMILKIPTTPSKTRHHRINWVKLDHSWRLGWVWLIVVNMKQAFSSIQDRAFTDKVKHPNPSSGSYVGAHYRSMALKHHSYRLQYFFQQKVDAARRHMLQSDECARSYDDIGSIIRASWGITHSCCCLCWGNVFLLRWSHVCSPARTSNL